MRGFTLVEILVVAVIFALMMAGITGVLNLGYLSFPVDLGQMEAHQQARQLMSWATRELRQSRNLQILPLTSDMDQIIFNSSAGLGISYYPDSGDFNGDGAVNQIVREYPAGTRRIIAGSISRFKFNLNNNLLRIEIRADKTVSGRNLSFVLIEQIRLRNE